MRVAEHLESWFVKEAKLRDRLEQVIKRPREEMVIAPLVRLVKESAPEADPKPDSVIRIEDHMSA